MLIEWTKPALDDLVGLRNHIRRDSPIYAEQFIARIFEATARLNDIPADRPRSTGSSGYTRRNP